MKRRAGWTNAVVCLEGRNPIASMVSVYQTSAYDFCIDLIAEYIFFICFVLFQLWKPHACPGYVANVMWDIKYIIYFNMFHCFPF